MTERMTLSYVEQIAKAYRFIQEGDHFLVVAHVQPDGDAISSTLAVGWLLRQWNKSFVMVNENGVPNKLSYLPMSDQVCTYEEHNAIASKLFDTVICVDCAAYVRIGKIAKWIAKTARVLNIDHHPTNDHYGEVAVIREGAAATVEILFDMFTSYGVALDIDVATTLYTGLVTDTGGFRYHNTSSHVLSIASDLLRLGVNGYDITIRLLEKMSMAQMQLTQRGLVRLSFSENRRIGWLYITLEDMIETGARDEDIEGLVNYPRHIEGVEVSLLFKQIEPFGVKVSMRSAALVNVAEIAQHFGGGGHVRAAGCEVAGTLDEVIANVVERVNQAL